MPVSPEKSSEAKIPARKPRRSIKKPVVAGATSPRDDSDAGRRVLRILLKTVHAYWADNISRLGAALAFYTTIAVAPLLVLAVAVAGIVFDESSARQQVIGEVERLAGSQASAVISSVQNPVASTTGTIATLMAVGTLIFGSLGVFQHLQDALNAIWRVQPKPVKGWMEFVHRRLFSLATVMMTGFLLLVSLIASSVLSWLGARAVEKMGLSAFALEIINNSMSFGLVTCLFAMIFKLLPDTRVRWHHVWLGAALTAVLFTVGKSLLALYLGHAAVTSAYGAAGSLVALLLWCYYAAQIVFFGAEFTRITAMSEEGRNFAPLQAAGERSRAL